VSQYTFDEALNEVAKLFRRGDFDKALELIDDMSPEQRNRNAALVWRGRIQKSRGAKINALLAFQVVLKRPSPPKSIAIDVISTISGVSTLPSGIIEDAVAELQQRTPTELIVSHSTKLDNAARYLCRIGERRAALKIFRLMYLSSALNDGSAVFLLHEFGGGETAEWSQTRNTMSFNQRALSANLQDSIHRILQSSHEIPYDTAFFDSNHSKPRTHIHHQSKTELRAAVEPYFDAVYYRARYRLNENRKDELDDYINLESAELRDPSPYFSAEFYAQNNKVPDGSQPLVHYNKVGVPRGVWPKQPDVVDLRALNFIKTETLQTSKSVSIIIPVYNNIDAFRKCIASLIPTIRIADELIIVDDNSIDASIDLVLQELEESAHDAPWDLTIIRNQNNIGFPRSVNVGIRASDENNNVIVLNSDTMVCGDWISNLDNYLQGEPRIGSVTPVSNHSSVSSFLVESEAGMPFGLSLGTVCSALEKVPNGSAVPLLAGSGFCIALSRQALNVSGLFSEEFGRGYYEDTEWCARSHGYGFVHVLASNVFVFHDVGSKSFGKDQRVRLSFEARYLFVSMYPDFDDLPRFSREALNAFRLEWCLRCAEEYGSPVQVILDHGYGGGSFKYIYETLIAELREKGAPYVLLRLSGKEFSMQIFINGNECFFKGMLYDCLWSRLASLSAAVFHLNGLHGASDPLDVLAKLEVAIQKHDSIVYIHDFFPISPIYSLLDPTGAYSEQLGESSLDMRLNPRNYYFLTDIASWREAWSKIFQESRVVCFSQFVKEKLRDVYGGTLRHIEVHSLAAIGSVSKGSSPNFFPPSEKHDDRVVGFIGNMNLEKGAGVVRYLVDLALKSRDNFKFVLIGPWNARGQPPRGLHVHGTYEAEELENLLRLYSVDAVSFTSVVPETFSYTLLEVERFGIPVCGFNIGNQGLRLKAYSEGLVVPYEGRTRTDASRMLQSLRELLDGRNRG